MVNSTQTGVGGSDASDKPAVALVAASDNAEEIARAILRASGKGHEVIVTYRCSPSTESMEFAERLGARIIHPPDPDCDTESLKQHLVETTPLLSIPGIIFQSDTSERIDFEGSMAALKSGDRITDAVVDSVETKSDGGMSVDGSEIDTLSENGATIDQPNSPSLDEMEPSAKEGVDEVQGPQSTVAIIPAYNEAGSIREVITATKAYVDDVIVIDDSSSDNTREIASEHADGVVSHPKNMGVGGAVHTGYLAAIRNGYDVVIQIDGDGQHDPSYIPEMVEMIVDDGVDMVIGSRWLNSSYQEYSFVRRAGINFFTAEANVLGGLDITDVTSGFRAYRTSMLEDLGRPENSHWALEQTLEAARKGYGIEEVSVPMPPETEGSQFNLATFLKYPPRMILTTFKVLMFR